MRKVHCGLLALALPALTSAAVIHVPGDQPTVQAGIDAALAGDEVIVACGSYFEHDIQMKSGITLRGETGEAECVVIDAQQLGRVMTGDDLDVATLIEGITFTGGIAVEDLLYGGGAYFVGSALSIESCRFTGNYSYYKGGGISFYESPATIRNCLFDVNEGEHGGGGAINGGTSPLEISDCRFEDNSGIDGAALIITRSDPLIERCVFLDNDGWIWGGAVMCSSTSSPLLRNCTLVGNDAMQGGGVWAAYDSHPVLENCIVAFNTNGSGLFAYYDGAHPSTITVACCDLFHNVGGDYGGDVEDQTGTNGNFSSHPYFCDRETGDLSLATGSPCLPPGNECGQLIGALEEGCAFPTIIGIAPAEPVALMQNRPNPFNPSTEITFRLTEPTRVSLGIYDLGGRLVRTLIRDEIHPAGENAIRWDGRNERNLSLSSGLYLYRLDGPTWTFSRKLTLLK